jgi:dihydrofolate synthase/folylpolyglutamate synthase
MFSRTGAAALKMDLSNTIRICELLRNPQHQFKSIHIAGTNGKGSVSHMLAAILQSAGYKTGLYTSPHLTDFRERIKINGQMIPEERVIEFTASMIPDIETIEPSFFELTVGMAFDYFATEKVDVAVIETGLGGRLDSTNVITPELSIITTIGFDHTALLGNTLELIAAEKAGIIKHGIPALIGQKKSETENVFRAKADAMQAELYFADELFTLTAASQELDRIGVVLYDRLNNKEITLYSDLAGAYQRENIKTVMAAISLLKKRGWSIEENAISNGLQRVIPLSGLHGRWELLHRNPRIIADVAHNPDGILQLSQQLATINHNRLFIILGVSADKDVATILKLLPANVIYLFTQASIPRAMPGSELKELAAAAGYEGTLANNVNDAINWCIEHSEKDDLIVICGSVFIVGEINRQLLGQ